jgi:hypothetical protein
MCFVSAYGDDAASPEENGIVSSCGTDACPADGVEDDVWFVSALTWHIERSWMDEEINKIGSDAGRRR